MQFFPGFGQFPVLDIPSKSFVTPTLASPGRSLGDGIFLFFLVKDRLLRTGSDLEFHLFLWHPEKKKRQIRNHWAKFSGTHACRSPFIYTWAGDGNFFVKDRLALACLHSLPGQCRFGTQVNFIFLMVFILGFWLAGPLGIRRFTHKAYVWIL